MIEDPDMEFLSECDMNYNEFKDYSNKVFMKTF